MSNTAVTIKAHFFHMVCQNNTTVHVAYRHYKQNDNFQCNVSSFQQVTPEAQLIIYE